MYTLGEKIIPKDIDEEIKDSYLSYAMSVIVGRALPDARDGFKPVHRRILYAMQELHLDPGKPYKKSARIVGEVLGKYHPHGDSAVYDALVRMVQTFSLRYPLVDGQGNFGSVDGDAAAAMRYTEARQATVATEMLRDIEKQTVEFGPNFDGSLKEPKVLPSRLPNLLVNGSSGIAVGMATNIPPHNLTEVIDAACAVIDDPSIGVKPLMKHITGPDFPTGGIICGREGIFNAFSSGRGSIRIRAKVQSELLRGSRQALVITELPYQVNKANLLESIANLVNDKKLTGISDLRDESDKDGMRVVIELKRDATDQLVLNQLYKHTQMETSFGIIMLAIVENRPRVLSLKAALQTFIDHRKDVIIRRTQFELEKAEARAHILEGLKKALDHLDAVIETIRKSKSPADAKEALMRKFKFTDRQAQAILEMQLQRLTALERDKLEAEYLELIKLIEYYKSLLKNEALLMGVVKQELIEVKERFGDERRTAIIDSVQDYTVEDLIADEDVVLTISHSGYIKRLPIGTYRKQRRGGVGITAMNTKAEDFVEHLFVASTHETLMFFTNMGRCHWLKVYEIPQAGRYARGTAIVNLLQLQQGERLSAFINVKSYDEDKFLILATRKGTVKKTELQAYSRPRKTGIIAITLDKGDELIEALISDGNQELLLVTRLGKAIRFKESQVRRTGRSSRGVRGIRLSGEDVVISANMVHDNAEILSITQKGYGKRTDFEAYRLQSRGGKGVINLKITEKNGAVVDAKTVTSDDEMMLISAEGMMVRSSVQDIRATGRASQGVRVINLKEKDRVSSVARLIKEEEENTQTRVAEEGKNVDTIASPEEQLEFQGEPPASKGRAKPAGKAPAAKKRTAKAAAKPKPVKKAAAKKTAKKSVKKAVKKKTPPRTKKKR